jgi:hypothetical protein
MHLLTLYIFLLSMLRIQKQPVIDLIVNPLLDSLLGHSISKRQTTHRDLLLLYSGIIAAACFFFPLYFHFSSSSSGGRGSGGG